MALENSPNRANLSSFSADLKDGGINFKLNFEVGKDATLDELRKIDLIDGAHKIEIIVNNQILKLPGKYTINAEVKSMLKNMNGVNEIKLI